jgi:tRNA/rRNA methyltransferase
MSNFGFFDLRLVRPYEAAFRDARSAVGALAILENAREYPTVAEAVADCSLVVGTSAGSRHRDAQQPVYRLEAATQKMLAEMNQHKAALLFGSEKFGLSNDDLSHCHWLLHIPARAEHRSMNLGQSVALCLYEFIRDESAPAPALETTWISQEPATATQLELLSSLALEVLNVSGYLERHPRSNMQAEVRRLILRSHPGAKDAEAVLGMLRQLLWKMQSLNDPG